MADMKTLTINGTTYDVVDETARNAAKEAKNAIPTNKETWKFTLEDGSTVTKAVYIG